MFSSLHPCLDFFLHKKGFCAVHNIKLKLPEWITDKERCIQADTKILSDNLHSLAFQGKQLLIPVRTQKQDNVQDREQGQNDVIVVYFPEGIKKNEYQMIQAKFNDKRLRNVWVVAISSKITHNVKRSLSKYRFTMFTPLECKIKFFLHQGFVPHQVVPPSEVENIATIKGLSLCPLLLTEITSRFFNFKKNDIIRIKRIAEMSKADEYRKCQ